MRKIRNITFIVTIFMIISLCHSKVYSHFGVLDYEEQFTIEKNTSIYASNTSMAPIKAINQGEVVTYERDWTDDRIKVKIGDIVRPLYDNGGRAYCRIGQYEGYIETSSFIVRRSGETEAMNYTGILLSNTDGEVRNNSGNNTGGTSNRGGSAIRSTGSTAEDDGLGELASYKGTKPDSQQIRNKSGIILGIIQILGVILSVIMLIVLGIKYMLGSVEEKAEYKKTLVPYIIGAFLVFTGSLIPQLIYTIMQGF